MSYSHIFVAGTFEGLHTGHRFILTRAFVEGEKVTIGLTTDEFVKKFKIKTLKLKIRIHDNRKKDLEKWLEKNQLHKRGTIIPISDPYEPAASMADLDALIVTQENRKTGERINGLRQSSALSPVTLIEVPIIPAQDGEPISSTRLRNGEIDPDGRLVMPESLRSLLAKPLGRVLTDRAIDQSIHRNKNRFIITVGDIATKTLLDAGITPTLAIIDGKVGRKPFHETLKILQLQKVKPFMPKAVKSGPGYISGEAARAIQAMLAKDKTRVLLIDGEEDLLVLPAILHALIGSVIYYGQPGEGLVEVIVNAKTKKIAAHHLLQFHPNRQ